MRTGVIRWAIALVVAAAAVPAAARELCGFQYETIQELEAIVRADQSYSLLVDDPLFTAFKDVTGLQTFTFSKPAQPAWPAAACRKAEQHRNGDWVVNTDLHCFNTKEECDRLYRQYVQLDADMRKALESKHTAR